MTPFASIALFRRDGKLTFKSPRKEAPNSETQARKASSRFWNTAIRAPDKLVKTVLVRVRPGGAIVDVTERDMIRPRTPWVTFALDTVEAMKQPHLAACLNELGVDVGAAPLPLPDVLEINGAIYVRQI